jgi:caa(3)-type oxidase subunit IV
MPYYFDHTRTKEDQPAAHLDEPVTVFAVYIVLVIGAIATIGVSFAGLGGAAIYIHLLISFTQVALVGYFWMHLRRSDAVTWLTALSGLFFVIILFAWPLADYLTRHRGGL